MALLLGCGVLRAAGSRPFRPSLLPQRAAGGFLDPALKAFLEDNTEVTCSGSLTPEIQLRLLTPRCKFWWDRADLWPHADPYWAIYWPGGQALARYCPLIAKPLEYFSFSSSNTAF